MRLEFGASVVRSLIQVLLALLCLVVAVFLVIYAPGFRKVYAAGFFLMLGLVLYRLARRDAGNPDASP